MADTIQTSEAPAEENTGAENTITTLEDLSSFMEQVGEDQKAVDEANTEKEESPVEADASTNQDVLSNSVSESDEDGENEVEDSEENDEPPKAVSKLLKQVNKLTSRAKTAEENVLSLQDQIRSLKQNQTASEPQPNQVELDNIQTFEDLEVLKEQALAARKFALQNLGQDFVEADGQEYSTQDIANILSQTDEYLMTKIPQRAQYLQQKSQWNQDTAQMFPWLYSADEDPVTIQNREIYKSIRNQKQYKEVLEKLPNGDFVAGVLTRGIRAIQEDQAAKKPAPKKTVKKKTPPPTDSGDASPPIENATTIKRKQKEKILDRKTPLSENDLAAFLAD